MFEMPLLRYKKSKLQFYFMLFGNLLKYNGGIYPNFGNLYTANNCINTLFQILNLSKCEKQCQALLMPWNWEPT